MKEEVKHTELLGGEIHVIDRKKVSLSGIKKLVSYDPNEFVMETKMGPLVLKGSSLELIKLDISSGILLIRGVVDSIFYLNSSKKKESFWSKLFS